MSGPVRERAAALARGWIGTPFRHGSCCRGAGADCLGLVRGVWRELGLPPVQPPPYGADWALCDGAALADGLGRWMLALAIEAAEPGDVLAFRLRDGGAARHAAVLSGPGRMIHALEGRCVAETALGPWWLRRRVAAFRFPAR